MLGRPPDRPQAFTAVANETQAQLLLPAYNQDRGYLAGAPFARVTDGAYRYPPAGGGSVDGANGHVGGGGRCLGYARLGCIERRQFGSSTRQLIDRVLTGW